MKSRMHVKAVSVLSALAILTSISTYSVDAAGKSPKRKNPPTTTTTTDTSTTTTGTGTTTTTTDTSTTTTGTGTTTTTDTSTTTTGTGTTTTTDTSTTTTGTSTTTTTPVDTGTTTTTPVEPVVIPVEPVVEPVVTPVSTAPAGAVDMSISYGMVAGQTLYYNSSTSRYYTDSSFTQTPQKVSALLNKAFLDNKGKDIIIYVPEGDYLLDQPLLMQNGITFMGLSGKTRFFVDDSFNRNNDNFIISNAAPSNFEIKDIYLEYKSGNNPIFSEDAFNATGLAGIMLKVSGTTSAIVDNCKFIVKNNGIKTVVTPIWFRDGFSNVSIHDCYIENTTGSFAGGCIWFMNNNGKVGQNVNVYDNTIVKSGNDEAIGIWGNTGSNINYDISNNTINYTKGVTNVACDKLITVFANGFNYTPGTGLYKDIRFSGNNLNLTGSVKRIIFCDVSQSTFSNVVFEYNIIKDSVGDSTANTLLTTFEVFGSKLSTEDNEAMYSRQDISFNNNKYTNSSAYGRRCFASASKAILKLNNNVINSNFGYCVFYEENGDSKIVSTGNDYNYTGTGTTNFGFAYVGGTNSIGIFNTDQLVLQGISTTESNMLFENCLYK